jgi:hypothetical protein
MRWGVKNPTFFYEIFGRFKNNFYLYTMNNLDKIIETVNGYPVKDLRWLPTDNIIVGLVKCPIWGRESLHNGYVSCKWRKNGVCVKDKNRMDLNLKIEL